MGNCDFNSNLATDGFQLKQGAYNPRFCNVAEMDSSMVIGEDQRLYAVQPV
jgi:hypothetical protein